MWRKGPAPDIISVNAVLSACEKCGRWEQAFSVCTAARARQLSLNVVSYNSLISALTAGQTWQTGAQREQELFEEMRSAFVLPDVVTYNSLMTCCIRRKDWELVLAYLLQMQASLLEPDLFSYGSALAVCDQAENWMIALLLLEHMQRDEVLGNVLIYNSAMGACDTLLLISFRISLVCLLRGCSKTV